MSHPYIIPQTQNNNDNMHQDQIFETVNDFIIYSLKKTIGIDLRSHQNESDEERKSFDVNQDTKSDRSRKEEKNPNESESSPCVCVGILKWFNPKQHYGFIEYQQQDLFVHETAFINIASNEISDLINQTVTFNIDTYIDNKIQQMNQRAVNVFVMHTHINQQKKGMYRGYLLWFDIHKKFGFIQCDSYTKTSGLFVYESELKFDTNSIYHGMRLRFDIADDYGKQKKKAINVDMDTETDAPYMQKQKKGRHTGVLFSFNHDKKFGFIQCDDSKNNLFVYYAEFKFDKRLMYVGLRLQFDITVYVDHYGKQKKKAINVDVDAGETNKNTRLSKQCNGPKIDEVD